MSQYVTLGTVSAVLSVIAMIAAVFGKNTLSVFLNDPATAQTLFGIASGVLTFVAGIAAGVKKTEPTV